VNVAPGTAGTDAVNLNQLNSAVTGATASVPVRANNTSNLPAPVASGNNSLAVGFGSTASGVQSTAVGTSAQATGLNATAFGYGSIASGFDSTAVGPGAVAQFTNSTAIGQGVMVTRANQVAIGGSGNTYTFGGIASSASTAAQSGPTQFVTTDSSGNLAAADFGPTSFSALNGRVDLLSGQVGVLSRNLNTFRHEARAGTALALASSQIRYDERPGKVSIGLGMGGFDGEGGGALGLGYTAPDQRVRFNLSGGSTFRGELGVAGGVSFTLN